MSVVYTWQTIPNPFQSNDNDTSIIGHISGRSSDIINIITGSQSAIILAGAPGMGKTALVRYLCNTTGWTWRKELIDLELADLKPENVHFFQINLKPWEGIDISKALVNPESLIEPFLRECNSVLPPLASPDAHLSDFDSTPSDDSPSRNELNALQNRLEGLYRQNPDARYFVILDTIERLALPILDFSGQGTRAETAQEQGLALLDRCGVIRVLVDLIDNHSNFGVILSLETLPRPRSTDQFTHVSADLARFTTMTLQTFPADDAQRILAQSVSALDLDSSALQMLRAYGAETLFTPEEQRWLVEQAGTHPYLLQQLCFYTFNYKRLYMIVKDTDAQWPILQESDKKQISELVNERLSTFLTRLWNRLQEALEKSHAETRTSFYDFFSLLAKEQSSELTADKQQWDIGGPELHYLLSNEGIIRYELFKGITLPGTIIRDYLQQKTNESSSLQTRGFWLTLTYPGKEPERLSLSELEYHLIKTLLQHPKRCTEEELMKSTWGKIIERSTFTQRMHHLRKKLRERCEDKDPITNHYGGQYSLAHPEWLHLDEKI